MSGPTFYSVLDLTVDKGVEKGLPVKPGVIIFKLLNNIVLITLSIAGTTNLLWFIIKLLELEIFIFYFNQIYGLLSS